MANESTYKLGVVVSLLDKLSGPLKGIGGKLAKLEDSFRSLKATGDKWQQGSYFMAENAGKLKGMLSAAIDPAMGLEKGLAEVATLLPQLEAPQLEKLGEDFRSFLRDSPFKPADALAFLGAAQKAAVAGVADLNTAVDAGSSLLNAYGMSADQAGTIFDQLQTVVRLGKTRLSELGQSIGQLAPIANMAKIPFEQVGAAIAALTGSGVKTPEAMTSLRALFMGMAAPTTEAGKALRQIGTPALRAAAAAGDLTGVFAELGKLELPPDKLRKIFPDIEAIKAIGAALKRYPEMLGQMKGAVGEVDRANKVMNATLDDQWKIFKNRTFLVLEKMGRNLLPSLKSGLESLAPWLDKFSDFLGRHPALAKMGLAMLGLGFAALFIGAPLAMVAGTVMQFGGGGMLAAIKAVTVLAKAFRALGASASLGADGVYILKFALKSLAIIALLEIAVWGFSRAIESLTANWKIFSDSLKTGEIWGDLVNWVSGVDPDSWGVTQAAQTAAARSRLERQFPAAAAPNLGGPVIRDSGLRNKPMPVFGLEASAAAPAAAPAGARSTKVENHLSVNINGAGGTPEANAAAARKVFEQMLAEIERSQ